MNNAINVVLQYHNEKKVRFFFKVEICFFKSFQELIKTLVNWDEKNLSDKFFEVYGVEKVFYLFNSNQFLRVTKIGLDRHKFTSQSSKFFPI